MTTFTAVGPALNIDGPLPVAPEYSLLNTLRAMSRDAEDGGQVLVVSNEDRVFNGVNVWGYPVETPSLWEPCSTGTFRTKEDESTWDQPRFDGLIAYFPISCSTITADPMEFARRAEIALEAKLSFAVEQALAKGVTGSTNPSLGDANLTALAGGAAVLPQAGLNYLENAIGQTGSQGMILATPGVVSAWNFVNLITDENSEGYAETANGTPVASCGGIYDTDPVGKTGSTPTSGIEWAFAVGPVKVYLGTLEPPDVSQFVDREDNLITYRAEVAILPLWDTSLQAGVLVDWTP